MNTLFFRAFLGLLAYDLFAGSRSFARLHRRIRNLRTSSKPPEADVVRQVCEAVNRASVWYPKHVLCLQRAAVTTSVLRRSGVAAVMVLGAQKLPFAAHAWVEVDSKPINEKKDVRALFDVWETC